jgi:hypothetical protein
MILMMIFQPYSDRSGGPELAASVVQPRTPDHDLHPPSP